MTISPANCVAPPGLNTHSNFKNGTVTQIFTQEVTQYSTHSRENLRGLSSDTSRHASLDGFFDLSRGCSRELCIAALRNTFIDATSECLEVYSITNLRLKSGNPDMPYQVKNPKKTDLQDAFLTGKFFRSRTEVFSDQERKNFPPNNIQRKRSRELRCS